MNGPDRCDLYFKNGSYFELCWSEFERIDENMRHYVQDGVDRWISATGISGARKRFLLSQVESLDESTAQTRENLKDAERLYRNEKGWTPDD